MEVEFETTITGTVKCPCCGHEFEAEIGGTVCAEIEPPDYDWRD